MPDEAGRALDDHESMAEVDPDETDRGAWFLFLRAVTRPQGASR